MCLNADYSEVITILYRSFSIEISASERSDSHRMTSEFLSSCLHGQIDIIKEIVSIFVTQ